MLRDLFVLKVRYETAEIVYDILPFSASKAEKRGSFLRLIPKGPKSPKADKRGKFLFQKGNAFLQTEN